MANTWQRRCRKHFPGSLEVYTGRLNLTTNLQSSAATEPSPRTPGRRTGVPQGGARVAGRHALSLETHKCTRRGESTSRPGGGRHRERRTEREPPGRGEPALFVRAEPGAAATNPSDQAVRPGGKPGPQGRPRPPASQPPPDGSSPSPAGGGRGPRDRKLRRLRGQGAPTAAATGRTSRTASRPSRPPRRDQRWATRQQAGAGRLRVEKPRRPPRVSPNHT